MKIALIQMDIAWHDRDLNHSRARELAGRARSAGAEVVVFPEMFSTGFSMETGITAETLSGATPAFLRSLAVEYGMWVLGGFVLLGDRGRPKNTAMAVNPDGEDAALYSKVHTIPLLGEDLHYDAGDLPVTFDLPGIRSACFICYDLRFPELFRCVADACGLVFVVASWPAPRQSHWDILLRARAVENQFYVAGVNRVGRGGGHDFTGGSAILDPLGETLAQGGEEENVILADIDPERVTEVRKNLPFLRDRKPHVFQRAFSACGPRHNTPNCGS